MTFERALRAIKTRTESYLRTFFRAKRKEARVLDPACVELVDQVAAIVLRGGKRTRPFLCWLGYQSVAQGKRKKSVPSGIEGARGKLRHAMAGLELLQAFALIHDDIMDEDSVRRGGPSVHEHFRRVAFDSRNPKDSRNLIKSAHFGESMAILAGDLALTWADACMQKIGNAEVIDLYNLTKEQTIFGQSLDIMSTSGMRQIDKQKVNEIKTSLYSVVRPLQIGALLAGASQKDLDTLYAYGMPVGHAFQLKDDAMDGDIPEQESAALSRSYIQKAKSAILTMSIPDDVRPFFFALADFVITRRT
ncbi:MAG: Geranylgeranyl pyrophosphate synthase [Microgenomates group bacterium GW2011_GWA2_47_8]|nr:MAG: Geranylgeranyl pyrophosphate synthase [Microgenomates group bacterium GW2011_GWA2_47_8]